MEISPSLLQFYFLGVQPESQERIAAVLENDPTPEYASPWSLFARIDRPGVVAVRTVTRSTGLDMFLIANAMRGVEDVAEFMAFDIKDRNDSKFGAREALDDEGCLFITFLSLNWDSLDDPTLWEAYGIPAPSRSAVLQKTRSALERARKEDTLRNERLSFHIACGMGDSDLIAFGRTTNREALDYFLLTLTQLGTDCLAVQLGAAPDRVETWSPVFSASTTELAVPWKTYAAALDASKLAIEENSGRNLHPCEMALREGIDALLTSGLQAEVLLKRARGCLADVQDKVKNAIPSIWEDQAVLGKADMLLKQTVEPDRLPQLSDLVGLLTRLDSMAAKEEGFPRRSASILSFGKPKGQAGSGDGLLSRSEIIWPGVSNAPQRPSRYTSNTVDRDLDLCVRYLREIHDLRFRDEFRIIERMTERCAVLQSNPELPKDTRRFAQIALKRLVRAIEQLEHLESRSDDSALAAACDIRFALVNSGSHLDRTLHYLTRGTIPLLRGSSMHARITDHFSSETFLASALGTPAVAVAKKLAAALRRYENEIDGDPPDVWVGLLETLEDMAEPIIYSSHDLDFILIPPMGIIHVPRWVLWYPTSSSFILHELGHAVFNKAPLEDLMLEVAGASEGAWRNWCYETANAGVDGHNALENLTDSGAWDEWKREQHEIAAELFNRIFAYRASDSGRYLLDQIEHLHSIAKRSGETDRRSLISRALSIHIAHALACSRSGESLWEASPDGLEESIRSAAGDFSMIFWNWLKSPPPPFDSILSSIAADLRVFLHEVLIQLNGVNELRDYKTAVGRAVQRGVFMAAAATWRGDCNNNEKLVAQLAWSAILEMSLAPENDDRSVQAEEDEIVRQLSLGKVPTRTSLWPERLPRRLHAAKRLEPEKSVLIEHRFALILYLADWERVNRGDVKLGNNSE